MKRIRHMLALLLSMVLLTGLVVPASADNGVVTPPVWESSEQEWYTALSAETERSTGKAETQSYDFTVKANVAKLTVQNDGVTELDITINGQRLSVNTFFVNGKGEAKFDISGLVKYGANTMDVQALGKPGAKATFTVEAPVFAVRLLHTNDIHAAIDPLPKMAAYVKAAKAQGGNVFFVNAGDNFSGNPVSDLNQGKPMIEILNNMRVDLVTVGNHEFDHGPANTQARRDESNFPWLSANTVVADSTLTPIRPFDGYLIKENELGQKIAFIGLTETPPSTGAKNIVGLEFESPVAHAQRLIAELRDQVNLVVIVSHNGHDFDTAMAPQIPGADLILGAHSHTYLSKPDVVAGIPIIQVGSSAANLSDLIVTQTDKVEVTAGAAGSKYTVATSAMTQVDADVQAIVTTWKDLMAPVLNTKIGYNQTALTSTGSKTSSDIGLGSLIADGLKYYMDADIAVWNNGGIRADLPKGDITMNSVYKVLPFGNIPWKVEATGAQLTEFFARSFSRQNRNTIDLQVGGGSYVVYTKADGTLDRVALKIAGEPVDPNRVYTLAVSDYLATHREYWDTLPTPVDMSSVVDAIAVAEFVKHLGTVNYKSGTSGRIRIAAPVNPVAVSKVNFYNSSSLLASDADNNLVPLTTQATVLLTTESTGYQADRKVDAPHFPMIAVDSPLPLAAFEQIGSGKVIALGTNLAANQQRHQTWNWFTNLLDFAANSTSGTVLVDEGHSQYFEAGNYGSIEPFLADRGWTLKYTGTNTALTAAKLQGVGVLLISAPQADYTATEHQVIREFIAGGGTVLFTSGTDYYVTNNATKLNELAAAVGTVLRFNSDEVRDNTSKEGSTVYSINTTQFNQAFPQLVKVR